MPAKPATNVLLHAASGVFAMTVRSHRFKVGQIVNLIPSISQITTQGHFEIVSLRPVEGGTPQYWIEKSERIARTRGCGADLVLSAF
jgi:hypothetical protein